MCGILGRLSASPQTTIDDLKVASELIRHRGPDSSGFFLSNCKRVALAHNRLAILEIGDRGTQPMSSACDRYRIIFNGEIYNYRELRQELILKGIRFNSNSDTEVLLEGFVYWGKELLTRLNGPFAFAIFDQRDETLFLARDRMGEKPLYYGTYDDNFIFSSEQKAIVKLSKVKHQFDTSSLISYLSRGYPMQPSSMLSGIRALLPGHFLEFDLNTKRRKSLPFWTPAFGRPRQHLEARDLITKLRTLFNDAVRLQLHCDVPACVLLSGGLDSSLITAFASQHTTDIKTFTVKFSGYPQFDEAQSARDVAQHFATDHTEIEGGELSPSLIERMAEKLDSPINDSSLLPTFYVYSEVGKFCKVALGGDGGDELFGGYKHYSRLRLLQKSLGGNTAFLPRFFSQWLKRRVSSGHRVRNWIPTLSENLNYGCPNIREITDLFEAQNLLLLGDRSRFDKAFYADWDQISSGMGSALSNAISADFKGYLPESILVKTDRTSMLNSVEARAPFLDVNLVNFALNEVPDDYKASASGRKILLKNLGGSVLPAKFDFQRKLGFNLPLNDLIRRGEWHAYFRNVLESEYDFLDRSLCKKMLQAQQNGANHADKLFGIVLLIRWSQVNGINSLDV